MKTNILRKIALFGCVTAGIGLASCDDFLTITPTNSIVEEEFWEDKNDLKNVVAACYKRIVDNDVLTKYIQWGEMRSDNFERAAGNSSQDILNVMNANLLPTNGMFGWTPFYNCINYCNKVLVHGPEILEKDESFSQGDWEPIRAEAITLRAYCHFWLVRTFGEIPYVTQDYNNDNQELRLAQSTQLEVLDNIIADLESVKDVAMTDYNDVVMNHGRITRKAVYALLADVYLWRASYKAGNNRPFTRKGMERPVETYKTTAEEDYQKCVACCDEVISIMTAERKKSIENSGAFVGSGVKLTIEDLYTPNVASGNSYATSVGSYYDLFGTGNSNESIFELQVDGISYSNSMITDLFWNIKDSKNGALSGSTNLYSAAIEDPNTLSPASVFAKTDMRRWESFKFEAQGQTSLPIGKYIMKDVIYSSTGNSTMTDNTLETLANTMNISMRSLPCDANWIVYRLSDVVLMKAEAMSQIYVDEEKMTEAFNLCRVNYKRSNPFAYATNGKGDSLKIETFNTPDAIEALVMAERQREFIGEGKRWFDLVRYALRRGGTKDMLPMLTRKFTGNTKAVEAKLSTIQSLFSPINTNQIKNNDLLYQNEVWSDDETTSKTDEL